jgi:ferredoxin
MAQEALDKRGISLSAGFAFSMPGNCISLYGPPSESKRKKLFSAAERKLAKAVEAIKERKRLKPEGSFFPMSLIGRLVARRAISCLAKADRWFWVDSKCDCCGLCAKICPSANIELDGGRPKWKGNCEQCLACLQWCPREAIQFRNASATRARYRRDGVSRTC